MPFSTKFWGKCSIFSLSDRKKFTRKIMIKLHDHSLKHEYTACTTVFQLLPLQNLLFLMTKQPTTDQKVTLFLISKQHWTRTKVLFAHIQYRVCLYRSGASALTWGHSNTVYLLMKNFRNSRARQPTNHYFEQRRATTKTGKNSSTDPWS